MLKQIIGQKNFYHKLTYTLSFFGFGVLFTSLGPIIPYLSARSGLIQTEYTFLFSCRSAGMLLGSIMLFLLQKYTRITHHQMLMIGALGIFIFSWLFSIVQDNFLLGSFMFFSGIAYATSEVMINVCLLDMNSPEEMEFWLLFTHGIFGVGGLMGPLFVYLFGDMSFFVMGLLSLLCVPGFLCLLSPQKMKKEQKVEENVEISNNYRKSATIHLEQQAPLPRNALSKRLTYCLSLSIFLYVGMQSNYGGWVSSYAVIAGVSSKQQATKYATIYWIFITIFRISMAFFKYPSSKKLTFLSFFGVITTIAIIILVKVFEMTGFAIMMGAVLLGFSYSAIYPLVVAVPTEFGLEMTTKQATLIVTCGTISEGMVTMVTGLLMQHFSIDMLFYCSLVVNLMLYFNNKLALTFMNEQVDEIVKSERIQLIQKSQKVK